MLLMTKFGRFKFRLFATINMSFFLTALNIAGSTSQYWFKYLEPPTAYNNHHSHQEAGLWVSCPAQGAGCHYKNGIINDQHTIWSYFVRILIVFGMIFNALALVFFVMAFIYRLNKKSRCVWRLLETGSWCIFAAFLFALAGFAVFMANRGNYSMWLIFISIGSIFTAFNLLMRYFATFYFANTYHVAGAGDKAYVVSTAGGVTAPIVDDDKIAMAPLMAHAPTVEIAKTAGSNEALLPGGYASVNQPVVEVITTTQETITQKA